VDKQRIVERVARAVRGDYDDLSQWERENIELNIEDILHTAGFWELVEAAKEAYPLLCKASELGIRGDYDGITYQIGEILEKVGVLIGQR